MALTVADVLTRARDLLQDQTAVRWPDAELIRWLNDGRREISMVRPDLYAVNAVITLVAGTKQSVPSDGVRFMDGVRNVSATDVIGNAVRVVEREILDAQVPNWHAAAQSTDLKHFMFDERAPRTFYVYPPASAGHKLEITYSRVPTEVTATNTPLTEEEIYGAALADYVVARAWAKDAEYAGNMERASAHLANFRAALSSGRVQDFVNSPNTANVGGMPPRSGLAQKQA